MRRYLKRYIRNFLVAFAHSVNAFFCGDETISSHLGKYQRGDNGKAWRCITVPLRLPVGSLAWPFKGRRHCPRSIEEDEGKNAVFVCRNKED